MPPLIKQLLGQATPKKGASSYIRLIAVNFSIGLGVIALTAAISAAIAGRTQSRAAEARQVLANNRLAIERYSIYRNLGSDYRNLGPNMPSVFGAVPRSEDILAFSNAVELLARQTGNQVAFLFSSQEPSSDAEFQDIALAKFDATLYGTRDTFEKFIAGFDGLKQIGLIESLSIEGAQGIEGTAQMSVKGAAFVKRR
ncbi:hypothetical protein HY633_04365 [Candidatus Uhrbacteria bacterium]|nr:hypothetical protein [Candidatus Uhrbacteria bacterium]